MDPIFTSKRRLPAVQTDFTKCNICQLESGNHDLNYLTRNGIETFESALRIRKKGSCLGREPTCGRVTADSSPSDEGD